MRLAVLGVGLIGGSIGLAARKRLDATVAGFDPDRDTGALALERGAIDEAAGSVEEACAGAEVVVCAGPVGVLGELVGGALDAAGPDAVVTDVGSTKRELVERIGESERFIGGHPLAGAETAGVEHARAELFEGARWFLTPTGTTRDDLYERLARTVADIGARPQAIDASEHDRMLATLSHVPHVIANVLASDAASSLAGSDERLPEVGPSFRDTTRVAGANPGIWRDIYLTNRDAVADGVDRLIERLRDAAALLRTADPDDVAAWQHQARVDRRRLLEARAEGGRVHEMRVTVPNAPGVVAEVALTLGRAGVNIEDMALYPAADDASGAISLWIAGDDEAQRAAELLGGLGYGVAGVGGGE